MYFFVHSPHFFLNLIIFLTYQLFPMCAGSRRILSEKNSNLTLPNPLLAKRGNEKYGS